MLLHKSARSHPKPSENLQNPLIQTHNLGLTENQIEVLQRLRGPETLHPIRFRWWIRRNVVERRVGELGAGMTGNGFEHNPGGILEGGVAGDAIEDEEGLDGFGSGGVWSFSSYQ